ncbi:MAG: glycosyltransferase, partial [Hydrogenophaga sp.]|nr:glycosyltransferase [Hydrogenophaga sp.]
MVVPVYRAGDMLVELTERLQAVFAERRQPFELIFVED